MLTASLSPGSVTVQATVSDSHNKYNDTDIVKTKPFSIIAPSSVSYEPLEELPYTPWSSGTIYVGARTRYGITVNPTTVSFCRAAFRENFGDGETDEWPDGSTWQGPVGTSDLMAPDPGNLIGDLQSTNGVRICSKLYNGSDFEDFSPSNDIPFEYANADGVWIEFTSPTAIREYYGDTFETRVRAGGQPGELQGPCQGP